jgi:predicted O-methyltransferase YrrM
MEKKTSESKTPTSSSDGFRTPKWQKMNVLRLVEHAKARLNMIQLNEEISCVLGLLIGQRPDVFMEIGAAGGGFFWLASQVLPQESLKISVDYPNAGFSYTGHRVSEEHRADMAEFAENCVLIDGDSHSEAVKKRVKNALRMQEDPGDGALRAVDFLFIDADHSYSGVKKDWEMYAPLVRPGGLVAFHDVTESSTTKESDIKVPVFWSELEEAYPEQTFTMQKMGAVNCGIGVWQKPA